MMFATKRDCIPLAASDALANGSFRQEEGFKPNTLAIHDRSKETCRGTCYRPGIERESLIAPKEDLRTDDQLR